MEIEKSELEHLEKSKKVIEDEKKDLEKVCERNISYIQELNKYHWETKAEADEYEYASNRTLIETHADLTNSQLSRLRKLIEAQKQPYYGNFTFKVDGEPESETYYVGITNIGDDIIDWRCPAANMYYTSRLGKTSFKAPMGKIECTLENRKQIMMNEGKIEKIINSVIHINDEMLQEVLAESSGDKMKNIAATIQEEQNEIIRNITDRRIIVQGCAGSGKTSIGLHRLAYLLYGNRDTTTDDMLVFSPSDAFCEYISNVLPELGETNMAQTTFKDFAESYISGFDKLETYMDFISRYYDGTNTEEQNRLNKFKFSNEFKEALDEFVVKKSNEFLFNEDLSIYKDKDTVIAEYLNKLLTSEPYKNKPLYEKLEMLSEDVSTLYTKSRFKPQFKKYILNKLETMAQKSLKPKTLYNEFLKSESFVSRYGKADKTKNKKLLEYPDIIGMLYLNFELHGYPKNKKIRHLVIDEAQDYTPMQMSMINKLFSGATLTILGDANQTINPYHKYDSLEEMKKVIGDSNYIEINKAYRSSPEIIEYANSLIDGKIEAVRKSKNVPITIKNVNKDKLIEDLKNDVYSLKKDGYKRIAIITKSKNGADYLEKEVPSDSVRILNEGTSKRKEKNTDLPILTSAYMAKGLEFDAVILCNDKEDEYQENDNYLYYVAATRAQHKLMVYNEPAKVKKLGGNQ